MGENIEQKATVIVDVNGQLAEEKIQKLQTRASNLRDALAEAYKVNDAKLVKKLEAELKSTNAELRTLQKNAVNIDQVMKNLSTAGPKELRKTLNNINRELNSGHIKRGTAEWRKYNEQAKLVSRELRKIRVEQIESMSLMERFNNGLSKWGGTITSMIAGLTGVTLALNKMRKDRDDKEESADNLKALTGLDDDSIAWLTKQAEILSTTMEKSGLRVKQSSKDILEAYMLVGSAKPELLSDKEALNAVTIEAMRLAAAAKMDLKSSVDAITLSMNQYGASADEAARYTNVMAAGSKFGAAAVESVTTAVRKSGVAANDAGIPIEQLVGTIEALAEKGIKDEVAGTGLKIFFNRLQKGADDTNPKIVGLETALYNLQKKQLSVNERIKMFGEEAFSVSTVLINGAGKVKQYTEAVTGTSVAVEQAAINSANNAAKMAQMKNKLKEAGIELMERLNPSLNVLGTYFTNLIRILPPLIDFLQKHGTTIVYLTAVVGTYIAAKKLATLWETKYRDAALLSVAVEKLKAYWTKISTAGTTLYSAATFALKGNIIMAKEAAAAFFRVLKLNPFAAIITLLAGVAFAIYKFITHAKNAKTAIEEFYSAIYQERNELNKIYTQLLNVNLKTEERTRLINEFNTNFGKYLTNLLSEKSTVEDIKKAYNEATAAMNDHYARELLAGKESEIVKENIDKQSKSLRQSVELATGATGDQKKRLAELINDITNQTITANPEYGIGNVRQKIYEEINKEFGAGSAYSLFGGTEGWSGFEKSIYPFIEGANKTLNKVKELKEELAPFLKDLTGTEIGNSGGNGGGAGGNGGSSGGIDDEGRKKQIKQWEEETAQFKAHTLSMYAIGRLTKQESDDSIIQSDKDLLEKKMTLYSEHSKEYNDFLIQLKQMEIKTQEECTKENIEEIDNWIAKRKVALYDQCVSENLSKKAYEEGIIQLEREALVRKRDIHTKGSKEFNDYQRQIDDFDFRDKEKRQKEYEEKLAQLRKEYNKKSLKELRQQELDDLKLVLDKKLIQIEEYEKMKLAIEKKYAGLGEEQPGALGKASQRITDILNSAKATARNRISPEDQEKANNGDFFFTLFGADAKERNNTLSVLQKQEEDGLISHQEYLQAKAELDGDYYGGLAEKAQAAYAVVGSVISAVSDYNQACQDLEVAKINKKYDAEIKAAGKNSNEVKRLEEKKEKEIAKVKSKYADRDFKIQVAMGLAQTALAAINAYASGSKVFFALGPIAAAAAVAAGMLQIATIKKQQEAAKQGYYGGGFTPSGRWDEEQGTVHSGEFVANRFAVQNKEIFPVLRLIDNAQKNNTVGSLKAADVTKVLNQNSAVVDSAVAVNSPEAYQIMQMEKVSYIIDRTERTLDRLADQLDEGIEAHSILDGEQGQIKAKKRYDKLIKNKNRAA